jgi:hypothetical protein
MVWLLSFHRASCSLWNESIKTWSQALQSARQTWKPAGNLQRKKGKKSDGGCSCKVSFSLFGVEKILSFMMIQPPLQLSISFFNSIPHFNNFRLSPWSKKILRISPVSLGYILPAAEFSTLTLDIQMGISWASDIEIKWFKSPNSSTRLGLKLWWRSQSEIKSFYRTETDSNLVGQKESLGLTQKLTNAENPDMTESMN